METKSIIEAKKVLNSEIEKSINKFIYKTGISDISISTTNNTFKTNGGNVLYNQIEVEITINI